MTDLALRYAGADALPSSQRPAKPSFSLAAFLHRMSEAVSDAQRRRSETLVARMIEQNGGVLTDDLERRIGRSLGV